VVTVEKFTGEEMVKKLEELEKIKKNREYSEKEIDEINKKFEALKLEEKEEKEGENKELTNTKKDHMFEQYVRVIKSLNNPMMLYSNIPIPYNKISLNPKHQCKHCHNKL
jgi:ABC-type phosphate transport system auxiliary subunit